MTETLIAGTFKTLQDSWFPPNPLGNIRPDADFYVVPITMAKRIREAMGLEHNKEEGRGSKLGAYDVMGPGKHGPENRRGTFWLENFQVSKSGTEAAFRDTPALRAMVGRRVTTSTDGADVPVKATNP